jgi:hypothetical protein
VQARPAPPEGWNSANIIDALHAKRCLTCGRRCDEHDLDVYSLICLVAQCPCSSYSEPMRGDLQPPARPGDLPMVSRHRFELGKAAFLPMYAMGLSLRAIGLFCMCGVYSATTTRRGFVPNQTAQAWGADPDFDHVAGELVKAGLWGRVHEGFLMMPDPEIWRFRLVSLREDISPALRATIFARDGHRCLRCGTTDKLTIDHKRPVARGGTNSADNLQTLCGPCNSSKGARV